MGKTIRISPDAHATAKRKAKAVGMKLFRFIEVAIDSFEPAIVDSKRSARGGRKRAG